MPITANGQEKPAAGTWTLNSGTFGVAPTPAPDSLYMGEEASNSQVTNQGKDLGSHDSSTHSFNSVGDSGTGDSYYEFVSADSDGIEFTTIWGITDYPFTLAVIAKSPCDANEQLMTLCDVSAENVDYGMLLNAVQTGEFQIRRRNTTNITSGIDDTTDYGDDAWHLFAVVFESDTAMHGYVDGTYQTGSATSVDFNTNTDRGAIGYRNTLTPSNRMNGDITTVMVWKNTGLTNAQLDDVWANLWGYLDVGTSPLSAGGMIVNP